METGAAEARAIVAAIGKELSSVPRFELLQLAQGLDLPEEEAADVCREEFLEKWKLCPPRLLRVIDCKASMEEGEVVLIGWDITKAAPAGGILDKEQDGSSSDKPGILATGVIDEEPDEDDGGDGYCAISHTYGMDVYDVFDCGCAANCRAEVPRADPEKIPCKGMHRDPELQQAVIRDILGMCQLLVQAAEVRYAWHDGVCIAQHNKEEVQHFIRHMGWIYANAQSTVIFLHYIGRPMAPIGPGIPPFDLISRWQTRVWTFQEAALSRRRRYCVRTGASMTECSDLQEFEDTLASWYEEGGANSIEVLEEEEFWDLVEEMLEVLSQLPTDGLKPDDLGTAFKVVKWTNCLSMWLNLLRSSCQSFPTIVHALDTCSSRESKHEGDRINSILALAGVKNFDADKDHHVEESTLEFFKKMEGQSGLALALFTTNRYASLQSASNRKHTWFPSLSTSFMLTPKHVITREPRFDTEDLEFNVMDDGSLEVNGRLASVAVRFTLVEGGRGEGESNGTDNGFASGSQESMNYEENGMNELVVDLVNDQPFGSFRALVAPSSTDTNDEPIEIGSALLPTMEWDSGGEMKSNSRDDNWVRQSLPMVEDWLHAVPKNPHSADRERLLTLPVLPDELWKPVVESKPILPSAQPADSAWELLTKPTTSDSGSTAASAAMPASSFKAFIIFPGKVLERDFANSMSSHLHSIQASSISAFLVQGTDLDNSKVARIGCFIGSPALPSILQQDRYVHTCTFRNKLLIK